jgi:hypothetical protein
MMLELELAPDIENKFNRLPWCHRASPSTTRHESVKSTDADKMMLNRKMSNPNFHSRQFLDENYLTDAVRKPIYNGYRWIKRVVRGTTPITVPHQLVVPQGKLCALYCGFLLDFNRSF